MKFFLNYACMKPIGALGFAILLLTSCASSGPIEPPHSTLDALATSTILLPSRTPEIQRSPDPLFVPTETPPLWPSGTTDGYYTVYYYPSVRLDVFQYYWENNSCVISITYGEGLWVATLDKRESCGSQSILVSQDFPEQEIESASVNGFYVTSLTYGDGQWVATLSQTSNFSGQQIETYSTFPTDDIATMQSNGYWVTNVAYGDGSWVVVFSKSNQISSQLIETFSTFPWDYVDQEAADGMLLTAQAYGNNIWAIVLSNGIALEQDIRTQSFFSKDMVIQFWNDAEHYYEIGIFYGENSWFAASTELP